LGLTDPLPYVTRELSWLIQAVEYHIICPLAKFLTSKLNCFKLNHYKGFSYRIANTCNLESISIFCDT
jgi:hypothetical protein